MDLRNQAAFTDTGAYDGCPVSELLTEIASEVRGRAASEVREWQSIVAWADENVIESDTDPDVATSFAGLVDGGVPIAGPGAPLVSEFGLVELIAVLGRSPDGGRAYVGRVVACAWRLPNLYEAVPGTTSGPHPTAGTGTSDQQAPDHLTSYRSNPTSPDHLQCGSCRQNQDACRHPGGCGDQHMVDVRRGRCC